MSFTRQLASWILQGTRPARYPRWDHQRKSRIFRRDATLGSMTFVVGLTFAISGCSPSPESPLAPSPGGTAASPNVTGVIPAFGSAAGGSIVKLVGTGFMPG
jgi:hypothetical protein